MSPVQVEQVNPRNEPLLRALWEVGHAASAERPHGGFHPPWETFRRVHAQSSHDRDVLLLAAFGSTSGRGEVVGAARMDLPLLDNRHLCSTGVWVHPDHRRRGAGRALVTEVERVAAAHGRTTFLGEANAPPGADSAGALFGAALGYEVVHSEEIKVADLPATEPTWAGLEAHAAERAAAYELVWWLDPAPEEHLAELCRLFGAFLLEAPLGGLDLRQVTHTPERLRDNERHRADTGQQRLMVAAQAPDASLAGYTAVTLSEATPDLAFVNSTLVMPEHRGNRLGLAMKVRLHQLLRERFPACTTVVTDNAGVNTWMNAVNEQLGYRVVEHVLELQKVFVDA